MAILIPADSNRPLLNVAPKNGRDFQLAEFYKLLSCDTIEIRQLPQGRWMVLDEDGKFADKPRNERATRLAQFVSPKYLLAEMARMREAGMKVVWMRDPITDLTTEGDFIVGDVLIAANKEVQ